MKASDTTRRAVSALFGLSDGFVQPAVSVV